MLRLVLVLMWVIVSTTSAIAEELMTTCHRSDRPSDAIKACTEVLRTNKKDQYKTYHWRGKLYFGAGDYDRAIADYTKAIESEPSYRRLYLWYADRGHAHYAKKDYGSAIRDYSKVIELRPTFYGAYYSRAVAFHANGNLDQAIVDYNLAIKEIPPSVELYVNRGGALQLQRKYDQAIADFTEAIKIKADSIDALVWRGSAWEAKRSFWGPGRQNAITDYKSALALEAVTAVEKKRLEFARQRLASLGVSPTTGVEERFKQSTEDRQRTSNTKSNPDTGAPSHTSRPFGYILLALFLVGGIYLVGKRIEGITDKSPLWRKVVVGTTVGLLSTILSAVILRMLGLSEGDHLFTLTIAGILVIAFGLFA